MRILIITAVISKLINATATNLFASHWFGLIFCAPEKSWKPVLNRIYHEVGAYSLPI